MTRRIDHATTALAGAYFLAAPAHAVTTPHTADAAPTPSLTSPPPYGTHVIAGDGAYVKCTTKGSAPLHFTTKGSHTFTDPGIYPWKVRVVYCGRPEGTAVAEKTVNVVIPAASGATSPQSTWMTTSFLYSTKGRTLTYRYIDAGVWHLVSDDGKPFDIKESGGYDIDFGDGATTTVPTVSAAPSERRRVRVPCKDTAPSAKHTYARSGSYTVKATGYYCGGKTDAGKVTKTYHVTVGGVAPAPGTAVHPTTPT